LALNVLLLGGYRFAGRAIVAAAQARGHAVTAFNRGNLTPMPGVEQLTGDRDAPAFPPERRWDVAIDTSGYIPRHVGIAATALRDRIGQYVFVSSLSVYPFPMPPGLDETAAVQPLPDGADPDDAGDAETYGARKAACEAVLGERLPGRVLAVRAGFIVGPHDNTDRFNSWIERAARPQPLIVPAELDQPMQLIDARDLAAWIVQMAERRASGVYNVTGPEGPLTLGDVARTCIAGTGSGRPRAWKPGGTSRSGSRPASTASCSSSSAAQWSPACVVVRWSKPCAIRMPGCARAITRGASSSRRSWSGR
jgi:2'-hydroxyisoflavone reductase